jgi:hypothetical protein
VLVDSLSSAGADFIKVYENLPRDVYYAIVQRAGERNLPVVGHTPQALTPGEVSDAGQPADLALLNVNIIDVQTGAMQRDRSTVIDGNRIAAIGPAAGLATCTRVFRPIRDLRRSGRSQRDVQQALPEQAGRVALATAHVRPAGEREISVT